jgi:hypothetical protein
MQCGKKIQLKERQIKRRDLKMERAWMIEILKKSRTWRSGLSVLPPTSTLLPQGRGIKVWELV